MKIGNLILLAGIVIAAILSGCGQPEYYSVTSICRECGAHKNYTKRWDSNAKSNIDDTPESIEVKRLLPEHKEHKWVDVSGTRKSGSKPALSWDGNWRGWETFNFIVNSPLSDDQKRDFLKKLYAIDQRPWKKSKNYKAFQKYEETVKRELKSLTIEVAETLHPNDKTAILLCLPENAQYQYAMVLNEHELSQMIDSSLENEKFKIEPLDKNALLETTCPLFWYWLLKQNRIFSADDLLTMRKDTNKSPIWREAFTLFLFSKTSLHAKTFCLKGNFPVEPYAEQQKLQKELSAIKHFLR